MKKFKALGLLLGAGFLVIGTGVGVIGTLNTDDENILPAKAATTNVSKTITLKKASSLPQGFKMINEGGGTAYLKVKADTVLTIDFASIKTGSDYYLCSDFSFTPYLGTFQTWNAPKTLKIKGDLLDANDTILSTSTNTYELTSNNATQSGFADLVIGKPTDFSSVSKVRFSFIEFSGGSIARFGKMDYSFENDNAPIASANPVTGITIDNGETLLITEGNLGADLTPKLEATVNYEGKDPDKNVTWSVVSGPATINKDGIMQFSENGTAVFKATSIGSPKKEATISVTTQGLKMAQIQKVEVNFKNIAVANNWVSGISKLTNIDVKGLVNVSVDGDGADYNVHEADHQVKLADEAMTLIPTSGYKIKDATVSYYMSADPKYNNKFTYGENLDVPNGTLFNVNSGSLILSAQGHVQVKNILVTIEYDELMLPASIQANWALNKGTYVASELKAAKLSTDHITVGVYNGYNELNYTVENGIGLILDITNGAKVDHIDATSTVQEFSFVAYAPGKYQVKVTYLDLQATLEVEVIAKTATSVIITTQPKTSYNANFDVYTEFEGGNIRGEKNDGGHTTSVKNFVFEYSMNGLPIDINTLLDANGCFNLKAEATIKTDIFYKDLGRDVFATYNITVHPVKTLVATDANADTNYFTNVDYPMTAAVTTTINGTTYDVPETDYTISPATLNVAAAGDQTITVTYNKDTKVTTTYTVNVKAPKGEPNEFVASINSLTFTAGDKFAVPAQESYGMITYLNDEGIYDITTLENIAFYLSEDNIYDEKDILLNEDYVMRYYDIAYDIIPVYTEGAKSIQGDPITFTVSQKVLPTYVAGSDDFGLLKDASLLKAGSEFLFADSTTHTKISTTIPTGKDYLDISSATYDAISGKVTITDEVVYKIILGGTTDAWTFKINGQYLEMNKSGRFSYTTDANAAEKWTIAINQEGIATVSANSDSNYKMKYNSSYPRFRTYDSAQTDISIILNDPVVGTDPAQYIIDVIDTMRLNSETLVEGEGLSVCTLLDNPAWAKVKEVYNANKDNHDFKQALSVIDKYSDGESTYLDTINKLLVVDPKSQPSMFGALDDSSAIIYTIVGIAIVSITFIGAFALIANKKRHSLTK